MKHRSFAVRQALARARAARFGKAAEVRRPPAEHWLDRVERERDQLEEERAARLEADKKPATQASAPPVKSRQ